jgi:hypothetical protein
MPFDFAAVTSPFRMQPGLRRLAPGSPQLTPQQPDDRACVEKLGVLTAFAHEALVATPDFDASAALRALCGQATREQPHAWRWDGAAAVSAPQLGWSLEHDQVIGHGPAAIGACLRALPAPWRLAGLLSLAFAEDFAVLDANTGRIPWLAVCLPSHWAPEEKAGRHFAEVHAPVADNQLLINAADHLTHLVTAADRWERFVWTITREPCLRMHPRHLEMSTWPSDADAQQLAAQAHFRSERQTFIPLPGERQAVFTIHVESRPLAQAVSSAGLARKVHDALASMSPQVLAYRGLVDARARLLEWLSERAAACAP